MECSRRNLIKLIGASSVVTASSLDGAAQLVGQPSADTPSPSGQTGHVMAIAAHPGDGFFAMGAPVALAIQQGGLGTFVNLSLGGRGSATIPSARYGAIQREASESAALKLGAKTAFLEYEDGEIPVNEQVKIGVCDLIRQYKPTVIVTHWKGSWHKDHRAVYDIVNDAIFYASLPAITRDHPAHTVGKVFYNDKWEDANEFEADIYLDTTQVFDKWFEACATFPMWRGENGFRYNDYYRSRAVACGCLSGSQYAVALMSAPNQLTRHLRSL